MLDFKNKLSSDLLNKINSEGQFIYALDEEWIMSDEAAIQLIIDNYIKPMPDLLPAQFFYLLAKYSIDNAIDILLVNLKNEDLEKYAKYKAFLTGARYYEYDKTMIIFNDIKDKLTLVDPSLIFTNEQLITMWEEATLI